MRSVIIGAGLMGRWHADAAARAQARVVAVHDRDVARALYLAARSGAEHGTDLDALLDRTKPDVAHVCTPLGSHVSITRALLSRGVHAIVEKPLAETAPETAAILAEAAAVGRVVCPVHQMVFQRWLHVVEEVGEMVSIDHVAATAGGAGKPGDQDRVVEEILPHPLSLFEQLVPGSIRSAFSVRRPQRGELAAETEHQGVLLRTAISTRGRPTRHELRIMGTNGTLHVDLFHGYAVAEGAHSSRAYKIGRPFIVAGKQWLNAGVNLGLRALGGQAAYPGLRELIARVYSQIDGTGAVAIDPSRALAVAEARDRILGRTGASG